MKGLLCGLLLLTGCAKTITQQAEYERLFQERMQNVMAEEALQNFEVELGLKSPDTATVAQASKDLGPATAESPAQKQTN